MFYYYLTPSYKGNSEAIIVLCSPYLFSITSLSVFIFTRLANKTRFEIGINLKGQEAEGKLEAEKPNSMRSHKIKIADINEIDKEVINWIKTAYENAK